MQVSKIALTIAFYSLGVAAFPMKANCGPTTSRELQNGITSGTKAAVNHGSNLHTREEEPVEQNLPCGKCGTYTTNDGTLYFRHFSDCDGKS
ncbi:hypothetical protein PoMZ_08749 [Pyricularia oryzae]|uniref:Uncharacterized protein n=1 Tax=Pyricularia oryzae TaxID=318829 RepID=A0A4P7NIE9_PYROR|nr:hypothetical protein PoMZ_08749 [Pyricularia oryzae]